jgi:photosystem II stability/assembly factor-like uncharacterized protein
MSDRPSPTRCFSARRTALLVGAALLLASPAAWKLTGPSQHHAAPRADAAAAAEEADARVPLCPASQATRLCLPVGNGTPAPHKPTPPLTGTTSTSALSFAPYAAKPVKSIGTYDPYMGTPPIAGRAGSVAVDPSNTANAYLGTPFGGIWKTTNGGGSWKPISDGKVFRSIGALAVDPNQPATIYAGTGDQSRGALVTDPFGNGIYKSTDGGATWKWLDGFAAAACAGVSIDICSDPSNARSLITGVGVKKGSSNVVIAAASGAAGYMAAGLYRSTDGGTTWSQRLTFTGSVPTSLTADPAHPSVWYAGVWGFNTSPPQPGGVWKSTDSGKTWNQLSGNLPTTGHGRVAVAAEGSDRVYALFGGSGVVDPPALWRSTNAGASWTKVVTFASDWCQCLYDLALSTVPSKPGFVAAGGVNLSLVDTKTAQVTQLGGGKLHVDIQGLSTDASGRLWVASDGGVYRLTSDLATVSNLNVGLPLHEVYRNPGLGLSTSLLEGTQDVGTNAWDGLQWTHIGPGDGWFASSDTGRLWSSTQSRQLRVSTDGGAHWQDRSVGIFEGPIPPGIDVYATYARAPANRDTFYAGMQSIWRTKDAGVTWKKLLPNASCLSGGACFYISTVAVAPGDPSVIYAGVEDCCSGRLRVSTDSGATWATRSQPPQGFRMLSLAISPANPAVAYIGRGELQPNQQVFLTKDYGKTWTNLSQNLPPVPVQALAVDWSASPRIVYAGTGVGVYWSNGGAWQPAAGLPGAPVTNLMLDKANNRLLASTYGRGWYQATPLAP